MNTTRKDNINNMISKSINLYLIDGTPTGRIKCTMQNWTGVAYKVPRNLLNECYNSGGNITTHLKQSGIYFLIGENDDGNSSIYVGQAGSRKNGEGILLRLSEHKKSDKEKYKDYWNEVICFTTTINIFGPTEISYLENKFTNMAKKCNRYKVFNSNEPNGGNVTEEKESELEEFIEYAKIFMGVLGYNVFEPLITNKAENNDKDNETTDNIRFIFNGPYKAYAELTNEGFVLLKDSEINTKLLSSASKSTIKIRNKHQQDISNGKTTCDILFNSPSAASAFVAGRSSSGNVDWKTVDGKSPKDF